ISAAGRRIPARRDRSPSSPTCAVENRRAAAAARPAGRRGAALTTPAAARSEEHTSELQSLMRISYAVFCLKKKTTKKKNTKKDNNIQTIKDTQNSKNSI